jgi:hypothetical protein
MASSSNEPNGVAWTSSARCSALRRFLPLCEGLPM